MTTQNGKHLGDQPEVADVDGNWKDPTENVNGIAANLTGKVRYIAYVSNAVTNADLSLKFTANAKRDILGLKITINVMVDQLDSYASEVTRMDREVGTEGTLNGQGKIQGVPDTWKDLTDSVNCIRGTE